jgi:hypothetical protein
MDTSFWLSLVYTLRTSQDHLNLEKNRFSGGWVNLFEQARVEIIRACKCGYTQKRCPSDQQQWADSLIEESTDLGGNIQDW